MSIKVWNEVSKRWESQSTLLASSLKMIDANGNFISKDAEGCIQENATKIKKIESDVKYIYENGTIGGGGSGGGGSMPSVTVDGEDQYVVNSDEIIDIYYFFNSPNPGYGTANLSFGSNTKEESIPQGRNRWTVGPFSRGKHILSITVQDKQGFWSQPAKVTVISGSIELQSTFDDSKDFTLTDDITIPFTLFSELPDSIKVDLTLNGATLTKVANIGANEWKIGNLPFMGVSEARIKAYTDKYESNVLSYTLVAANSETLFVSSTFNAQIIEQGKRLMIDYRISMKGQYKFYTDLYINGNLETTVTSNPGVNFWDIGTNLPLGQYNFRITARTTDGLQESTIELNLEVVSAGYDPFTPVETGLVAYFDANGKLNNSLQKDTWQDESGNNISCKLYNFNFVTNGWIDNALHFNGKTYAEIDYAPFLNGVKTGFTFDIVYKCNNVGDIDGKVIHCRNPRTPFQGISIDTQTALLATKNSEIVSAQFQEDTYTRQTWVIDRSRGLMLLYINAVLSNISYLQKNDVALEPYEDEFSYNEKIILGAARDLDGNIVNNSSSHVKIIRIYNRALNKDEILQNHIADIKDRDEQLAARELNFGEETIPILKMVGNLENFGEGEERIVQIDFNDPKDPTKRIIKDGCLISWQGTSSRDYPVKNYTIKLREGGMPLVTYAPKEGWLGEDRWTLKANYMDSSHSNNIGTNKFIHDFFKPYPYPSQIKDPSTRANVDGFPLLMMINNQEVGLYTWNIDRYAPHNYGFIDYDKNNLVIRHPNAVSYEIAVNSTSGAGAFWDSSWESIRAEFKHRYNFRGEEADVTEVLPPNQRVLTLGKHNELVDLVTWVAGCTEAEFYAELDEHFSVRHLIDYFLIAYSLGMVD